MTKALSMIPVAALLLLPSNLSAKERPGAAVVLALRDGRMLKGELYAVKTDTIIVVDDQARTETTAVADVRRVDLKKRIGRSVRTGAIVGGAASLGLALGTVLLNGEDSINAPQADEIAFLSVLTLGGAAVGALVGWMAGEATRDKTIVIEGLSGQPLNKALSSLRKYARAPSLR